ncbi:MAG TPA: hypothetical protein VFY73_25540 [Ideonella sp.]|uniref:hypothetical protein n=1 Tax=Ideonella sp. TaxID=1929293 RepID=UPI002E30BE35|nr:hypothetical protein [Ideonella sp.]HEX5687394.1 hypothetical protein [Ideonella sp.]
MTGALPLLLNGFVSRVRPLLGSGIGLRLHVAADCPEPADVDAEHLEAALAEMVRRVIAAMPAEGWLDLQARASRQPPAQALIGTAATAGTWLALSVGSPQAGTLGLDWDAPWRRHRSGSAVFGGQANLSHGRQGILR